MCWRKVRHHPVQRVFDLCRFAPRKLAWNFRYVHHPAGCHHTYRQHRCPRWSHGVCVKGRLIWLDFFLSRSTPRLVDPTIVNNGSVHLLLDPSQLHVFAAARQLLLSANIVGVLLRHPNSFKSSLVGLRSAWTSGARSYERTCSVSDLVRTW